MSDREELLTTLQKRLQYRFRSPELLDRALIHRSYAHERGLTETYERLEFLGDAVIGLATAERLYDASPPSPEGEMAAQKSHLVSARVQAGVAAGLGLGEVLRLSVGEERSGGREKTSLLADVLEAVVGAVFRDGGYAEARRVVLELLDRALELELSGSPKDSKSELQERAHAEGWGEPSYHDLGLTGQPPDEVFRVECRLDGKAAGTGEGRSKKRAQQRAAAAALSALADGA